MKTELLALLAEAHAQRETRLFEAKNGLPAVVWIVLIGFNFVLMAFVAFAGLKPFLSLTLCSVTYGTCVGATLVLVLQSRKPASCMNQLVIRGRTFGMRRRRDACLKGIQGVQPDQGTPASLPVRAPTPGTQAASGFFD